jgi:spermidine synthase
VNVEVGDARLRLGQGPDARFDVLVLDAFSADAIPVHLVTKEAIAVYRRALAEDGVLLAHVSNEHMTLQPIFAALARQAGMLAVERRDLAPTEEELVAGKNASEWVLLSESRAEVDRLVAGHGWSVLEAPPGQHVWTDDYANVLGAMRF